MAKFAIGEICEVYGSGTGKIRAWAECEIIDIPFGTYPRAPEDKVFYIIKVPSDLSRERDGSWAIDEKYLRKKKRPPVNENEKKFFNDLDLFIKNTTSTSTPTKETEDVTS